jgi:hypothetical protein
MAVARTCALGICDASVANSYAAGNSHTGNAQVDSVCGPGALGACMGGGGTDLYSCPANPSPGTNYVDVTVTAESPGGSTLIPPTLAGTLSGNAGYKGTTVAACAQAEWGGPTAAYTVAFTISACEWDAATSDGTSFGPQLPSVPSAAYDQTLTMHSSGKPTGCDTEPAGADGPGFFGWTTDSTGHCDTYIDGSTYGVKTGVSASHACQTELAAAYSAKALVYVPVYTSVSGTGDNGVYTLKGFAAFVITGYRVPSVTASDWLNPANTCGPPDTCVNGYFTQALIPAIPPLTGTNLGTSIVVLS